MTKIHELWSKKFLELKMISNVMERLKEMIAGHFTKLFPRLCILKAAGGSLPW